MKTKILARLLLPFFSLWLAVMPARSYAIAPVIALAPLVAPVVEGAAVTTALDALGLGVFITAVSYLTKGTTPAMKVKTDTATPFDLPTGWTRNSPTAQPTPPSSATVKSQYSTSGVRMYDTISNAALDLQNLRDYFGGCSGTYPAISCVSQPYVVSCSATSCIVAGPNNVGSIFQTTIPVSNFLTCPAGYTVSGSTCALSNPSKVIKPDGMPCEVGRTGNTFAVDAQNPDCVNTPARVIADNGSATVSNNTINLSNLDGRKTTVVINPDGTTTITSSVPDVASKTTTTTTTVLSAPDTAGKTSVTGQTTLTTAGVGALASTTPVTNNYGSAPAPIVFPTDYNREATQAQIVQAVTVTGNTIPILDSESQDITNLTNDSGTILPKFDRNALNGKIDLPSDAGGTCQPMQLNFLGRALTADICPAVLFLHPLVNYLFVFLFGILCFKTAFKNDELK